MPMIPRGMDFVVWLEYHIPKHYRNPTTVDQKKKERKLKEITKDHSFNSIVFLIHKTQQPPDVNPIPNTCMPAIGPHRVPIFSIFHHIAQKKKILDYFNK